jgi:hypothetical protein
VHNSKTIVDSEDSNGPVEERSEQIN